MRFGEWLVLAVWIIQGGRISFLPFCTVVTTVIGLFVKALYFFSILAFALFSSWNDSHFKRKGFFHEWVFGCFGQSINGYFYTYFMTQKIPIYLIGFFLEIVLALTGELSCFKFALSKLIVGWEQTAAVRLCCCGLQTSPKSLLLRSSSNRI